MIHRKSAFHRKLAQSIEPGIAEYLFGSFTYRVELKDAHGLLVLTHNETNAENETFYC